MRKSWNMLLSTISKWQIWGPEKFRILKVKELKVAQLVSEGNWYLQFQFSRSVVSDSLQPMSRSTPGLPVHHQLPEFTQTHVLRVTDAIQPSHPLSSPSPLAPKSLPASESFPMTQLFAWGGQSTGVSALASFLPQNTQDWSPLGWTGWISL